MYLGLQCPHHSNPADFIVDKIIDHEQEEDVAHGKVIVVASCDGVFLNSNFWYDLNTKMYM